MIISPTYQYFTLCGINIYYYGIVLAIAIFIAIYIANSVAKKYYNYNFIFDNAFILVILGVLGARLYFCLLNQDIYFYNPLRILNLREGGLSIHGAIITGILGLYYISKKYKFPFFKLCDVFAVTLPLGQSIGRWGNFINSEAFGTPSNSLLKLYIEPCFRPNQFMNYDYFHPTFLYESVLDFCLFFVLYFFLLKRFNHTSGVLTGLYLVGYSLIRIFTEHFRIDCTAYILNIAVPTFISLITLILGIFLIISRGRKLSSK